MYDGGEMPRLSSSLGLLLALSLSPVLAFAQGGVTPLAVDPYPLASGVNEFRGYVTIEDNWDLFGVFRRGLSGDLDFGLRLGYTDAFGDGLHLGGDIRYGLPIEGTELAFALAAGLQFTFADFRNVIAVPFGVSIGADIGNEERSVILYGLPHFLVEHFDFDRPGDRNDADETELEFGLEMGGEIGLTRTLWFHPALTIATNDDDNVELALGIIYRR
jgi:hypothetical protein